MNKIFIYIVDLFLCVESLLFRFYAYTWRNVKQYFEISIYCIYCNIQIIDANHLIRITNIASVLQSNDK